MAKNENLLFPQTKSKFHLGGKVTGLDNPRKNQGYISGTDKNGNAYHRISFAVKTSNDNIVDVELYGSLPTEVYFYNRDKKETKKFPWSKRNIEPAEGWSRIYSDYEIVEKLHGELSDGDMIKVHGELDYSSYVNTEGQTIRTTRNRIRSFDFYEDNKIPDFDSENFKEYNYFTQELIVDNVFTLDGKYYLSAYVIKYGEILFPVQYELDETIAKNMKRLPFGTFLKAEGIQNNRVITEEIETDNDGWGVRKEAIARSYERSVALYAVDPATIVEKRYTKREIDSQLEKQIERSVEQDKNFNPERKENKQTPGSKATVQNHFDEEDDDDYDDDIFA